MANPGSLVHGDSDLEELANTLYALVRDGHIPAVLGAFKSMIREKRTEVLDRLILRLVGEGHAESAKALLKHRVDPVLGARGWLTLMEETGDVKKDDADCLIACVNAISNQDVRRNILMQFSGFIRMRQTEKTELITLVLQKLTKWPDRFFLDACLHIGRSPYTD